jgi:hypothetical protein
MSVNASFSRSDPSARLMLPSWINKIWIYVFGKHHLTAPATTAVSAAVAKDAGLDEFGRVEFAMPGFGTC